jgi:hypothetical protein
VVTEFVVESLEDQLGKIIDHHYQEPAPQQKSYTGSPTDPNPIHEPTYSLKEWLLRLQPANKEAPD